MAGAKSVVFMSQLTLPPNIDFISTQFPAHAADSLIFIWTTKMIQGVRFSIVLINMDPSTFFKKAREDSMIRLQTVLRWARSASYSAVGLGSLTASISQGGEMLIPMADRLGIRLDHGDAMSTALAYQQALDFGLDLGKSSIGIVGAVGVMGACFAKLVAAHSPRLVLLVVRQHDERSARLCAELQEMGVNVRVALDFNALHQTDLVYTVQTGQPIQSEHLRSGTVVLDAGVPAGVHASVSSRDDVLVLSSGCGVLPYTIAPQGVGVDLGLGCAPHGSVIYGCMIGCILAEASGVSTHQVGPIDVQYARDVLSYGRTLGVTPQPNMSFGRSLTSSDVAHFIRNR